MNDRTRFDEFVTSVRERLKLNAEEVPLDLESVKATGKYYSEDTWFCLFIRNPLSLKALAIVEIHGDNIPVISVEIESSGVSIIEIVRMIKEFYPHFEITLPFYHEKSGKLYYGQDALVQYTTKSNKPTDTETTLTKTPKSTRFN